MRRFNIWRGSIRHAHYIRVSVSGGEGADSKSQVVGLFCKFPLPWPQVLND